VIILDILEGLLEFFEHLNSKCKFCKHDRDHHHGAMGPNSIGQHFFGLCTFGNQSKDGYFIYGHCGCWHFTPKWKFWVKEWA
jgi:hypothetical protein